MATSATLKVPEKAAKKLLKEMNSKPGATPRKLEKQLLEIKDNLNGESIEDMDLSSPSKSLLEEISEAVDEDRDVKVVTADLEEDEEQEEEETPKKRKTKTKTQAKVKTKTQPKTQSKSKTKTKVKSKKSKGEHNYSPEYQAKVHESGMRVKRVIEKATKPMTVEEIATKAKVTESRVQSHINYRNRGKKNPPYNTDKKGRVSLAD